MSITYRDAGVDQEKADAILGDFGSYLKTRPRDPRVLAGIGPFAACFAMKNSFPADPVLVSSCDGVGTKVKLALDWDRIDTLGEDLVGMNVNDVLCAGGRPLFFLDYFACGKLEAKQLTPLLKSVQRGCELAQCSLIGGETAEMPGVYHGGDIDLAGFTVGIADRKDLLGPEKVKVGDDLIAIESSGFHSNGYSLLRKIVEKEKLSPDDKPPFSEETWRELLLKPTTIYVAALNDILSRIHAAAHLTGGGLLENLVRVLPDNTTATVESSLWIIPELFRWAQSKAGLSEEQLLTTFNCGVGMVVVCDPKDSGSCIQSILKSGLKAWKVGAVEKSSGEPQVVWR